jgi:hypothetical protein
MYYTLTLAKSKSDVYDYTAVTMVMGYQSMMEFESSCNRNVMVKMQMMTLRIKAHFIASCSEVIVSEPLKKWTYNKVAFNLDGSTKPLSIKNDWV